MGFPLFFSGRGVASVGYGYLDDNYYSDFNFDINDRKRDNSYYKLLKAGFTYENNSFLTKMYPTAGSKFIIGGAFVTGYEYYKEKGSGDNSILRKMKHNWIEGELVYERYSRFTKYLIMGSSLLIFS